jgi:hypothetical protein
MTAELTSEQEKELRNLKSHFPFRIAYLAIDPATGKHFSAAVFDKRQPNKYARKGFLVFTL